MKKRTLAIFMIFVLAICSFPASAFAERIYSVGTEALINSNSAAMRTKIGEKHYTVQLKIRERVYFTEDTSCLSKSAPIHVMTGEYSGFNGVTSMSFIYVPTGYEKSNDIYE